MAKLPMKKMELIAMLTDSKKIVELLQRRGVVELCENNSDELENASVSSVVGSFDKFRNTASAAVDILDRFVPEKVPITEMFSGKTEVATDDFGERAMHLEKIMNCATELIRCSKKISDAADEVSRIDVRHDILKQWAEFDLPLNFKGTATTSAFIGSLPYMTDADGLKELLPEGCYAEIVSASKEQTDLFVLCSKESEQETENVLRKASFLPLQEKEAKTPQQLINECIEEKKDLLKQSENAERRIKELASARRELRFAIDYLQMRKDKYEALNSLGFTENTFVLTGYIPEKYVEKLRNELEKKFTVYLDFTDPGEDEDVPVLLENSRFSAPVEGITKMYAMPSKKDVDPTPVMSFFYYLFFGMMLSDAGYGIVMVIGTSIALKKLKLEESMKKTLIMFRNCGISTIFWGALFGSWFGDIIQVVAKDYFGKNIDSVALWFEPLDDPIKMLLFSFGLGIIHLFLGVAVSFKMTWDEGKKLDAVLDTVPVYLTILGVAPLAAGILTDVPSILKTIGTYVLIAGVALIILTSGRSSKSVFGKFFGGLYALYNTATGYLSDILSYSRLLALGLATGSIAGVINLIGAMPQNMIVKTIVLIVVFIVGHTANMAINLLGAYVHTDRLQFVELFSKFYTGGGREFSPLTVNTKYIRFKEENINE